MKKQKKPYDDEYRVICQECRTCNNIKKAWELHKRMKPYGDGVDFLTRCPKVKLRLMKVVIGIDIVVIFVDLAIILYRFMG